MEERDWALTSGTYINVNLPMWKYNLLQQMMSFKARDIFLWNTIWCNGCLSRPMLRHPLPPKTSQKMGLVQNRVDLGNGEESWEGFSLEFSYFYSVFQTRAIVYEKNKVNYSSSEEQPIKSSMKMHCQTNVCARDEESLHFPSKCQLFLCCYQCLAFLSVISSNLQALLSVIWQQKYCNI